MRCSRRNKAVSPVIGTILVLAISLSTIASMLLWGIPYIESRKVNSMVTSVYNQFKTLDDALYLLVQQGLDASTVTSVAIEKGSININPIGERIIIFYSLNSDYNFSVSGLDDGNNTFKIRLEDDSSYDSIDSRVVATWLDPSSPSLPEIRIGTISKDRFTTFQFGQDKDIKNMVRIDLINNTFGGQLFGRIWLFDTGSITYDLPSSVGEYKVVAENLGIVVYSPAGPYLRDWPVIYNTTDSLSMRILNVRSSQGGSGAGIYRFLIQVNDDECTEANRQVYYFKIQIYGDYSTVWRDYFKSQHGFGEYGSGTLYRNIQRFSLVYSLCNVNMGLI